MKMMTKCLFLDIWLSSFAVLLPVFMGPLGPLIMSLNSWQLALCLKPPDRKHSSSTSTNALLQRSSSQSPDILQSASHTHPALNQL